jgi:hypothetical protein
MVLEAGKGETDGFFVLDVPRLPSSAVQFEDFESAVREFYTRN